MPTPSLRRWLLSLGLALAVGLGAFAWIAEDELPEQPEDDTGLSEDYERKLLQEIGYLK